MTELITELKERLVPGSKQDGRNCRDRYRPSVRHARPECKAPLALRDAPTLAVEKLAVRSDERALPD